MLVIPAQRLAPDTLRELIRDWLTRQSQDWDFSFGDPEENIAAVEQQLSSGKLLICWDEEMQSLNLLTKEDYQRLIQQADLE